MPGNDGTWSSGDALRRTRDRSGGAGCALLSNAIRPEIVSADCSEIVRPPTSRPETSTCAIAQSVVGCGGGATGVRAPPAAPTAAGATGATGATGTGGGGGGVAPLKKYVTGAPPGRTI